MVEQLPSFTGFVLGIILFVFARLVVLRAEKSKQWPQVPARVTDSKIVKSGKAKVPTPKVTYTYEVHGKSYTSRRLAVGPGSPGTGDAAAQMIAVFSKGAQVQASVDPLNPSYAVLLPGIASGHRLLMFIGGVFILNGIFFLFVPVPK